MRRHQEARRQAREIQEAAERERILGGFQRVDRGPGVGPEDQRVAIERARDQPVGAQNVEVGLGADALALRAPFEVELLPATGKEDAVELVVGEARKKAAALEPARRRA